MKVEVDVLGSPSIYSPCGLCGRKVTCMCFSAINGSGPATCLNSVS